MDKNFRDKPDAVVFYGYPKLIYIWPIILLGFLFYPFTSPRTVPDPDATVKVMAGDSEGGQADEGEVVEATPAELPSVPVAHEHEVFGWIYLVTVVLVILTIGVDVERNYAAFWAMFIAALWLACWLLQEKNVPVFTHVYNFFADMDVDYSRGYGLAMSIFLTVPYCTMLVWARVNHKWRITHNEFEHYSFGRADDSLARGAKRVRTTYPDVLEALICGAGTLVVYSATGRSELRRIHNVPLLFLLRSRINRILEAMLVTTDEAALEEEIADEQEDEREPGDSEGPIGEEKL